MKKNKILTICLVSLLALSSLTGCGKNKKDTDNIESAKSYVLSEGTTPINSHTGLSFDMYSNTRENYTVYGETEGIEETILYDSTMISTKLLGTENMKIIYTAEIPHSLLLLCDENVNGTVFINGQSYDVKKQEFELELEAGEYTITTTDVDIYYVLVNEVNHTITINFSDGMEISFNLDDVEVTNDAGNTIYTFWDGTEVKVDTNKIATVIKEGTSGIFSSTFIYDDDASGNVVVDVEDTEQNMTEMENIENKQ